MPKSRYYRNSKGGLIEFSVYVTTCPNLRDDSDIVSAHLCKEVLRKVFDSDAIDPLTKSVILDYPERWANFHELSTLPYRLLLTFPNISQIRIKTHSSYMVNAVHHEHIALADSPVVGCEVLPTEFQSLKFPSTSELLDSAA